jgi:hypothetical protein
MTVTTIAYSTPFPLRGFRSQASRIVLRYLLAISFGFAVGYFVKSELRVPATDTDNEWQSQFNEEKNHGRILKFQKTMEGVASEWREEPGRPHKAA